MLFVRCFCWVFVKELLCAVINADISCGINFSVHIDKVCYYSVFVCCKNAGIVML